jgi:hypothetical protein
VRLTASSVTSVPPSSLSIILRSRTDHRSPRAWFPLPPPHLQQLIVLHNCKYIPVMMAILLLFVPVGSLLLAAFGVGIYLWVSKEKKKTARLRA